VTSSPAKPHGDLEELARDATPGPWHNSADDFSLRRKYPTVYATGDELRYIATCANFVNRIPTDNSANAAFIAAAHPARILSLVGEVRSLKGALGRLTSEVGALWHKEYAGAAFGHLIGPTNYDVVRYCLEDARRALLDRDA
jgi:hypothetical protein